MNTKINCALIAGMIVLSFALASAKDVSDKSDETNKIIWGKQVGTFRLGVQAPKTKLDGCEPVIFTIHLKNVSDKPSKFLNRHGQWEIKRYGFDIKRTDVDPESNPVTLTDYGDWLQFHGRRGPKVKPLNDTLAGGKTLTAKVCVSRVRDLTLDGEYLIKIRMSVQSDNSKFGIEKVAATVKIQVGNVEKTDGKKPKQKTDK